MTFNEKILDHFDNPRNVGSFGNDDTDVGTGIVGAPECGDVLKLQIRVDQTTGTITDTCFKACGSGETIAASSLVTELIKGKTLDEASAIADKEIAENLDLSRERMHCSIMAEGAIRKAIRDYRSKHESP